MAIFFNTREQNLQKIIELEKSLNEIQDFDVLLERILTESRKIVNADAGSIYVVEGNRLKIRYAQCDTKKRKLKPGQKLPFKSFSFDINERSMNGSAALSKKIINEPNVYEISPDKKYSFDKSTDMLTGYISKSIISIPLIAGDGKVIGVLQIINAQDENGNIVSFDEEAELYLNHFATSATQALVRANLTREMVMRMVAMAGFRDPKETATHVNRVASFSVEIYDRWAFDHNVDEEIVHRYRDTLKIAAMLHDVGKVGISDLILKKPGKFTEDEYSIIKTHSAIGAKLFLNKQSEIDRMAYDVALHHHEWWNGHGYPGNLEIKNADIEDDNDCMPMGMSGKDIPLAARIVAVADVFDALSSKRVYKQAWSEEDVFKEMKKQSGIQFDPEIIEAFFESVQTIREIQAAYPD